MKFNMGPYMSIDLGRTKTPPSTASETEGEKIDNISAQTPEDQRVASVIRGNIRAFEVSTVFACVNLIVRNAASCRPQVRIYDRKTGGLKVPDSVNHLERLLRRPNTYQTPEEFYKQAYTNLRITGNCFIFVQREFNSPTGRPLALYNLPSYAVKLRPIGTNQDRAPSNWRDNYEYIPTDIDRNSWWGIPNGETSHIVYSQITSGGPLGVGWNRPLPGWPKGGHVLSPEFIIHIRDTSLDGVFGLSTEGLFKELHGWERALQLRAAGHARKDGDFGAIVGVESTSTASKATDLINKLRAGWRYVATDGKVTVNRRSDSPRDSMLVEQLKFLISEIGRIYGVPPSMLGDDRTQSSARGIEEINRQFISNAISPLQELLGQGIRERIIPNWDATDNQEIYEVKWDRTHLIRASTAARTSYGTMMSNVGGWNVNDLRIAEGYPPLDPDEHPFAVEYIRGMGGGMVGDANAPVPDNDDDPDDDPEPEDEGGLE